MRHILIVPEEKNDDGTYTDAAWTAAEQKAQSLLDEWKAGEHTEDSFAFLAAENSADTGSASNGGLYEEVYPGQMVDAFDAWCFDAARQPGDIGIVKTEYGAITSCTSRPSASIRTGMSAPRAIISTSSLPTSRRRSPRVRVGRKRAERSARRYPAELSGPPGGPSA